MTKEQTIFFTDSLQFNTFKGGIIDKDTEILSLVFLDTTRSCDSEIVGKTIEWKPFIWLEHEGLKNIKEIKIYALHGDMSLIAKEFKKKYKNTSIKLIEKRIHQYWCIDITLKCLKKLSNLKKTKTIFGSIATMRYNRILLFDFCKKNNIILGHKKETKENLQNFQIKMNRIYSKVKLNISDYNPVRFIENENMRWDIFLQEITPTADNYFLSWVPHCLGNENWKYVNDPYFFHSILCENIPFILAEKNANTSFDQHFEFQPYMGFDLKNDALENPYERWKKLLNDNKNFFSNVSETKDLYDHNIKTIKFNKKVLIETNWKDKFFISLKDLPDVIVKKIHTFTKQTFI